MCEGDEQKTKKTKHIGENNKKAKRQQRTTKNNTRETKTKPKFGGSRASGVLKSLVFLLSHQSVGYTLTFWWNVRVSPYALVKNTRKPKISRPRKARTPQTLVFVSPPLRFCLFSLFCWFIHEMDLTPFTHEWNGSNLFNGPSLQSRTRPF